MTEKKLKNYIYFFNVVTEFIKKKEESLSFTFKNYFEHILVLLCLKWKGYDWDYKIFIYVT